MFARLKRSNRNFGVNMRRGANDDGVDVLTLHGALPVGAPGAAELVHQSLGRTRFTSHHFNQLVIWGLHNDGRAPARLQARSDEGNPHEADLRFKSQTRARRPRPISSYINPRAVSWSAFQSPAVSNT